MKLIRFMLYVFLISLSACTDKEVEFRDTFYAYNAPTTLVIAGKTINLGPALYELEFKLNRDKGHFTKLSIQEFEFSDESGGSWSKPFVGTEFTPNGYIDHYEKPIILYGDQKSYERDDHIQIIGNISQGKYLDPFPIELEIPKKVLIDSYKTFSINDSLGFCFDLALEGGRDKEFCSSIKYFFLEMIEEYERSTNNKMTKERKEELLKRATEIDDY